MANAGLEEVLATALVKHFSNEGGGSDMVWEDAMDIATEVVPELAARVLEREAETTGGHWNRALQERAQAYREGKR